MNEIDFNDKTALIQVLESNLWEGWSTFGRAPGGALHYEVDALWFETPIPTIPYNGILKFQVEKNSTNAWEVPCCPAFHTYGREPLPITWL